MRILVVCSWGKTAFEVGNYCRDAFLQLGHNADLFVYNDEKISSRIPFLHNLESYMSEKQLIAKIAIMDPHLLLVIKGNNLLPEAIRRIKRQFKLITANYWIDDPNSIAVSSSISSAYDYFFTNDPESVKVHKVSGCLNPAFLTFGCMPYVHRRMELSSQEQCRYGADVCFSGTVYEQRLKILEALSGLDLKIWSPRVTYRLGEKYSVEKRHIKRSSSLYAKFTGRAVWGGELAKVYSASKVVINIHAPQGVPIMRDFEATGCGAFLLTDHVSRIGEMFKPGEEVCCYKNTEDMKQAISFYLSHPEERKEIAARGQIRAYKDHTYVARMKELISKIGAGTA